MPTQLFTLESLTQNYPKIVAGLKERYAARLPMDQLLDQYRVSESNSHPPEIHFAIPVNPAVLNRYAGKHGLTHYWPGPRDVSPATVFIAAEHLSKHVDYELQIGWPFQATQDCPMILILYNNYTMEDKLLIDEDQEDVIEMVQEALNLDRKLRPKWYFDIHDTYQPDD